jgi:hypothetical protein
VRGLDIDELERVVALYSVLVAERGSLELNEEACDGEAAAKSCAE